MKRVTCVIVFAVLLVGGEVRSHGQDRSSAGSTAWNAPNTVSAGTRFIIGLQDNLSTANAKSGERFHGRTLEPLATASGYVLSPGMEVRGHVDKVEAARKTGRARIWLTFDEVRTPQAGLRWLPIWLTFRVFAR